MTTPETRTVKIGDVVLIDAGGRRHLCKVSSQPQVSDDRTVTFDVTPVRDDTEAAGRRGQAATATVTPMRTAETLRQTRDPLPEGVTEGTLGPTCETCRRADFIIGGPDESPITRSSQPAQDGRYLVQSHHDWCPVWTRETPAVACPACGAPVEGYDWVDDNDLDLDATIHRLNSLEAAQIATTPPVPRFAETSRHEAERLRCRHPSAGREPASGLDRVAVTPCGDVLHGDDARTAMSRVEEIRAEEAQRRADAVIDKHAALLAAAVDAGHGRMVAAYREAVQARSLEAPGLLRAIRLVVA